MSETSFVEGKCREKRLRIKKWKRGFSLKCEGHGTLMVTPFHEETFQNELKIFCKDCEEAKTS